MGKEYPVRPEIIKEFERASEVSLLGFAEHKEAGGKVAGVYCLFALTELVRAAGAIPATVCAARKKLRSLQPKRLCRPIFAP
jgi:benzoyl-CoA reductase/2-hydroxyglutaryl-CoA dehydratase subunit BcrC/BadD/HgdB